MLPTWGVEWSMDNTRSKEVLGIEYPDMKQEILDMVENLIELGVIENKKPKL